MIRIVKCNNCGAEYGVEDTDTPVVNGCHMFNRVCDTCFMPMTIKNPFQKETNNVLG